ncbi:protein containing tRNA pseudouridine synthase B [mine drainage metagenome]|uniref:Protein containing tRNA pseudouridine synthase B n=1 Tax=mine drainage metagenome TaxID=410659 RepID=T1B4D7_9ZZZZ
MTSPGPLPAEVTERLRDGAFLLIDKPRGPSSHQVTAWVRDLLGVERAGHAGTLDPNVSGLLWVGVGRALKLIPLILEFPKRYVGVMVLHGPVPAAEIGRVAAEFQSAIFQTPPVDRPSNGSAGSAGSTGSRCRRSPSRGCSSM